MGGAIFSTAGTLTLTNDTFVSNLAKGGGAGGGVDAATVGQGYGGAFFVRNGSLNATFDTFSSNAVINGDTSAGVASDLYVLSDGSGNQATAKVINSILGQNATTAVPDFYAGTNASGTAPNLASSTNNLVSDNPASPNGLTGTITGTNPNFAPGGLANNGGPTETLSLTPASTAAITKATTGTGIMVDQRGLERNASPDVGAFETQVPTVSVTDNGGTYDGDAFGATAASVVGLNNTTLAPFGSSALSYKYYAGTLSALQVTTAAALPGAPTTAGNYTVVGIFTSNVNGYRSATSTPAHFSIAQAQAIISIAGVNATYDGSPHPAIATASGVESPNPANLTSLLTVDYSTNGGSTFSTSAPVTPGTYEIYYTFAGNTDYLAMSSPINSGKAVVIAKATPTVNVTDSGGVYSGNPFSVTAASVVGVMNTTIASFGSSSLSFKYYAGTLSASQIATATALPGAPVYPGSYTVVGTFTSNSSSYNNAISTPVHFSITQAQAIVSITGVSVTYDTHPHPATATAKGVESPSPVNLTSLLSIYYSTNGGSTFTTSAPVAPGTYEIYYTFAGNTNYQAVSSKTDSGKAVVIAKVTPTIAATAGPTVVDGTGMPMSASAALSGGINVTGTITFALYTPGNVKVFTDVVTITGDGTYNTSAGTSTGSLVPTLAGTYQWVVTYSGDSLNNSVATTLGSTPEIAVGPGATLVGTTLYLVGGNTNDQISIQPSGSGIQVFGSLNGANLNITRYSPVPAVIDVFGFGGNDFISEASTLTVPVVVSEGNGNDTIVLGQGNNKVTVGNGNNFIQLGNGSNTVVAGNGTDFITLGGGSFGPGGGGSTGNSSVTVGNGNDTIQAAGGNNTIQAGNGNDWILVGGGNNTIQAGNGHNTVEAGNGYNYILLGNGSEFVVVGNGNNVIVAGNGTNYINTGNGNNLIVGGLGHDTIMAGGGDNILIDGTVQLAQGGDTLGKVLADWTSDIEHDDTATQIAALIAPRLTVTLNKTNANTIEAGRGFDWFWATYAHDYTNRKPTDLLN